MAADITVPTLGESVTTATIARWIKKAGEQVAADEAVVELETDKVTVEVNASEAGTLSEIIAEEGAEVEVGALLGRIGEAGAAPAPKAEAKKEEAKPNPAALATAGVTPPTPAPGPVARPGTALPAAAKMMEEKSLSAADIGTGTASAEAAPRPGCPRRARENDPAAQNHRQPAEGSTKHRRHADHLQRGGYERDHGPAHRIPRRL
jgi:2-oxoglutarate dehydrogenase E2 component (dihydrolipoamide succinyltransferase)